MAVETYVVSGFWGLRFGKYVGILTEVLRRWFMPDRPGGLNYGFSARFGVKGVCGQTPSEEGSGVEYGPS